MLLHLIVALPVLAGLAAYFFQQKGARGYGAMVAALQLGFLKSLLSGDPASLQITLPWIPELGLNWSLGVDGLNTLLLVLTPLLTLLAILSRSQESDNLAGFVGSLLILDGMLCGLFMAQNLGLFYIFFEAMLLPTLVLVAGWSKKDGAETALKFFLYTLVGSLPMLLGILLFAFTNPGGGSLDFSDLQVVSPERQFTLFLPFLLAFLVKMPVVPLHGWLPTLYKNSPASVTVVVAALMGKAGTYGLLKVGYTLFPDALMQLAPTLCLLAVSSIIYGALAALGSDSVKEVLAFSSLSHMAMIALGLFSYTRNGAEGASLQMVGHAVSTGGLFLVVALLERRGLPDKLRRYGGLAQITPRLAVMALFLTLASLGQPGLGGFPGELYILTGSWEKYPGLTITAAFGIVLAAAYLLRWYQKIFTGPLGTVKPPTDLTAEESMLLFVPVALSLLIGLYPALFLTLIQSAFEGVM